MRSTYHRKYGGSRGRGGVRAGLLAPSLLLRVWACAVFALAAHTAVARAATPASAPTLIIEGAGFGHGVGMSQDGALGLAEHGYSDTQILAHYYTGTAV